MIQDIRKRIFIIAGVIAGVVAALLLLFTVLRDGPLLPDGTQSGETPDGAQVTPPARQPNIPPAPPADPEEVYLKQLSRIFVERFQSYSNQNDNSHIEDVLPLSTRRMQDYVRAQKLSFDPVYSGVTTNVVASKVTSRDSVAARVQIDVQRVFSTAGSSKTEYESGSVQLQKENGEWKVAGLYWE